jgi:hypothetical protein
MAQFPNQSGLFGQHYVGQVGGLSNIWQAADQSLTRPANTSAYAANNAIGSSSSALFKFTSFFRVRGGSGLLTGLRVIASVAGIGTGNMGAIRAHLFNAIPTAANGLVDQGTFNTLFVDDASKLGTVDFSTWTIGGGGSNLIESYGSPALSPLPLIAAQGAMDLYAILVATAAFAPAAAQVIQAYASATLD